MKEHIDLYGFEIIRCTKCGQSPDRCGICGRPCCPCDHRDDLPLFDVDHPPRHLRSAPSAKREQTGPR